MLEQQNKASIPHNNDEFSNGIRNQVINRLRQINASNRFLARDEKILGIFKTISGNPNHMVITNYRIFGVQVTKPSGNIVFANELTEKDIQSVTVQAVKSLFDRISYILEIEKNNKKATTRQLIQLMPTK